MLTAEKIRKQQGDYLCRRCINRLYKVNLQPDDCVYGYIYKCVRCGEDRNIVVDFSASGKMKLLLK